MRLAALAVTTVLSLVGAVVGVVPASAASTVRVCVVNIQNTPDIADWKVRADARESRGKCDLILWQEIRERADHRAIQGKGWRSTRFGKGGVPVSWRTTKFVQVARADIIRVSRPTPPCATKPSYNPSRYITSVRLRVRATGQRFTAVSLHYPQRRTKCHQATTSQRWREAFRNTQKALPSGPLVVGGDWNRREGEIPDQVRGQHWVTPAPRSLDHAYVARTGWRVVSRFSWNLHSDHHGRGVRLR